MATRRCKVTLGSEYTIDPKLEQCCKEYFGAVPKVGPCKLDPMTQKFVRLLGGSNWPHVDKPGNGYICWPHHSHFAGYSWPEIWYIFLHEASHALKGSDEREATIEALKALPIGYRISTWRRIRQYLIEAGTLDIYLKNGKVFQIA